MVGIWINTKITGLNVCGVLVDEMFPRKGKQNYRPMLEFIYLAIMPKGERVVSRVANMHVFECGNTTHFTKECPVRLAKINRLKENCSGERKGKGNFINKKGEIDNIEAGGKNKGKWKTRKSNVRFAEVENDSPRNALFPLEETTGVPGANRVNFTDRDV